MSAMALPVARHYAQKIVEWLGPACERLEVAGSIRRGRPLCNDIDIVCIPKFEVQTDLLGTVVSKRSLVHKLLSEYVQASSGRAIWQAGQDNPDARNYIVQLPKCQLDIFCATPDTWGTLLLCRTGSKEHNIWLAQRAERQGKHWNPYRGVIEGSGTIGETEEAVYGLGLEFMLPMVREAEYLRRFESVKGVKV